MIRHHRRLPPRYPPLRRATSPMPGCGTPLG